MAERPSPIVKQILKERFGKDSLIALATAVKDVPYVRAVNAYYEEGAFYIVTHALSNKMKQLEKTPWPPSPGNGSPPRGRARISAMFGMKKTPLSLKRCAGSLPAGIAMGTWMRRIPTPVFYGSG